MNKKYKSRKYRSKKYISKKYRSKKYRSKKYRSKKYGGKAVGKGTYGCVFNPPLKCHIPNIQYDTNYVTKLMKTNSALE